MLFVSVFAVLSASADPITIDNHSFESPDVTTGLGPTPTGWTSIPYTIDNDHPNINPDPAPDGTQYAMLRNVITGYQVLSTKVAVNTTYTLTIDVAQRPNKPFDASHGVDVRLGTGSTAGVNLLIEETATTPIPEGTVWSTWTKTYTTGASVPDEFLRVEMLTTDATNDPQPCFDNVRLDAGSLPPSGMVMIVK